MVRYSDKFLLSALGTQANTFLWSTDRIPKTIGKLRQRLSDKMGEIIVRSSMLSSSLTPYYLMDTTRFVNLYDLQSIVQSVHSLFGSCKLYHMPETCVSRYH